MRLISDLKLLLRRISMRLGPSAYSRIESQGDSIGTPGHTLTVRGKHFSSQLFPNHACRHGQNNYRTRLFDAIVSFPRSCAVVGLEGLEGRSFRLSRDSDSTR